ncbi:Coiled-coil domain-containing protein 58, variant 2 [Clonorchis sinensis]|uniref:Protein MIX23 n=1 Tax=Clonorchis sinensis TaxID=79923 RepID=A0A8T1MZP4_CLOSI|nr:Coiled-coil domain-containing protein 58, variant 2 [Clonorchis sinensis]
MKVAGASADEVVPCDDFLQFSKVLNNLRRSDDRVRHELNTLLPTSSFQSNTDYEKTCKGFVLQMLEDHKRREGTIRHCLTVSAARLAELQRMQAPDDEQSRRKFLRSVKKQHLLVCSTPLVSLYVVATIPNGVIRRGGHTDFCNESHIRTVPKSLSPPSF